ncbi:MAG: hypothetical protein ACJ8FS_08260 [Sphingomicrobium sp.]
MILRLLNWQGIAGIALSLALGLMLVIQKGETHHWRRQSASFEQLYQQEQAAFATTVAKYRSAADQARAADKAKLTRVAIEQQTINERTDNDFEARLAAARAAAQRLRIELEPTADLRVGRNAPMPIVSAAAGGAAEAARKDGLPPPDALTATEQAIQLDELIKWVREQVEVDNNPKAVASPTGD